MSKICLEHFHEITSTKLLFYNSKIIKILLSSNGYNNLYVSRICFMYFIFMLYYILEYSTSRNENSFIFSIEPNMTKVVLSESENPVCYSSSYGPCFGRQELYAYGKNNVYRGRYREELGFQTGGRGRQITSESSGSLSQIEVFYKISY